MSRCKACDVILDTKELTKVDSNGVHVNLCTNCYTVSIAAHWELDNMETIPEIVNITQDELLNLQETYDSIYFSITKELY